LPDYLYLSRPFVPLFLFLPGFPHSQNLSHFELHPMQTLKDYWFDWKLYNPRTLVYRAGRTVRQP
ncbi:MAG: hypothetical protein L0387_41895, partial [Acidobacteria bacterium]|nr:hypothetical protein [Acidobacteriota bacterium]